VFSSGATVKNGNFIESINKILTINGKSLIKSVIDL